ncbi:MAG: DUF4250 domain-containing protein [Bacteroidaceae bacterium]|nr:DUF4250 domain-containing protein [Bacteroidaceae bacterium]
METENLPKDPIMLMSLLNMKLRDEFDSFEELCLSLGLDQEAIENILAPMGFEYMPEVNQFR